MKAAVFREVNQPMEVEEIEISKPGPREVLIRTAAAGVCHSDLHFFNGTYPGITPMVLGHESAGIVEQVQALLAETRLQWRVAGSRRTPESTLERVRHETAAAVTPASATDAQWLPQQLATAGEVWVSEDSVSMAYEAASSGARVGLLQVPARRAGSRVVRAAQMLLETGHAVRLDSPARRSDAPAPLQEAQRCARALLERWPDLA